MAPSRSLRKFAARDRGTAEMALKEYVLLPYGLSVRFEPGEDGYIIASCDELPGCVSQGKTLPEAVENIRDAILGYMALLEEEQAVSNVPAYTSTCESYDVIRDRAEDRTTEPTRKFEFEYASSLG